MHKLSFTSHKLGSLQTRETFNCVLTTELRVKIWKSKMHLSTPSVAYAAVRSNAVDSLLIVTPIVLLCRTKCHFILTGKRELATLLNCLPHAL